jgi:hypothetical protein
VVTDLLHAAEHVETGVLDQHVDGVKSLHGFGRDFDGLSFLVDIQDRDLELRVMLSSSKLVISPKSTPQERLDSDVVGCSSEPTVGLLAQVCRLRLKRPTPLCVSPRPGTAVLLLRPLLSGSHSYRFAASLSAKIWHTLFVVPVLYGIALDYEAQDWHISGPAPFQP